MANVLERISRRRLAGRVNTANVSGMLLWKPQVKAAAPSPPYQPSARGAAIVSSEHAAIYRSYAREGFLRNSVIYAAIMYKARAQRLSPLRAYHGDYDHRVPVEQDHPLHRLLARPNPHESWQEFNAKNVVYINISGNVFVHIIRDKEGNPTEMYSYRPDHVAIIPGQGNHALAGYRYVPEGREWDDGKIILPDDMIHISMPNPLDPYEGLGYGQSPLSPAAEAGDVDNATTSFLKDFFENGAMVASLLRFDAQMDEDDIARVKRVWQEQYGGWQNWTDIAVLEGGGEYQRIGLTFEEMGFTALDERNESRLLGPLGVPPILIFTRTGLERSTHSNYEQAREQFWKDTFLPELMLFEVEFQHYLNTDDAFVAFDLSNVPGLRGDMDRKVDAWFKLVSWGVPKNTAAEVVGLPLPELEDGRVAYMPLNYVGTTQMDAENNPPAIINSGAKARGNQPLMDRFMRDEEMAFPIALRLVREQMEKDRRAVQVILSKQKEKARKDGVFQTVYAGIEIEVYFQGEALEQWKRVVGQIGDLALASTASRLSDVFQRTPDVDFAGRYLHEHGLRFADPIPKESMESLRELFEQASQEGWSVDLTAKRLDELFDYWINKGGDVSWFLARKPVYRCELIAHDQLLRASNASTMGFYLGWNVPYKAWLATLDARTRPEHAEAHMRYDEAHAIPVEQPFVLADGSQLLFPGDPSLGADLGMIINCRCTIIPVWSRYEAQNVIPNF